MVERLALILAKVLVVVIMLSLARTFSSGADALLCQQEI